MKGISNMDKKSTLKKSAYCYAEKLELDLASCWIEADSTQKSPKPAIKTISITKTPDIKVKNRIGNFFRKYNIIAYGFSNDSLNIDAVFLLNGYACLCRAETITNNTKNITISLVSNQKPKDFMQQLDDAEIEVEKIRQGIYHFQYMFHFQIIVSKELPERESKWLKSLTDN